MNLLPTGLAVVMLRGMKHLAALFVALACGLTAACGLATEPPVRAMAHSTGDTCAATATGEELLVEISTERGIGRATVETTAGSLPGNITLRLRYTTGKPLPTLEGLTISTTEFTLEGATARPDDFQLTPRDVSGTDNATQKMQPRKEKLSIRNTNTILEIDLPQNLLGDAKQFNLQWVDYYRN